MSTLLAVTVAIGVGYLASVLPASYVAVATASLALVLLIRDRLYVLCALGAFYFALIHWLPPLGDAGGFAARLDDVLFAPLLVDSLIRLAYAPRAPGSEAVLVKLMLPVGVFVAYVGLSLLLVARWHPQEFGLALASFLRLLGTSLFVVIGFTLFTTEDRLRRFVGFLAFLTILSILMGGYQFLTDDGGAGRSSGFLNPNQLGSLSGLLVILAMVDQKRRMFARRFIPYVFAVFGFAGIFFARSIGSTLATVIAVGVYQVMHMRRDMLSVIRFAALTCAALFVFVALLFMLRSVETRGLLSMEGSSFVQRLILAHAGLEIFKENPVWGVGWRMSSRPQVIGNTDIGRVLRSQYPGVSDHFFPDVTTTSVHNFYVQCLAELGLVGTILFVLVVFYIGFVVHFILWSTANRWRLRGFGEYFALGLIFLLVWWNTIPLYGGQLDTFLCFIFLGGLAGIANTSRGPGQDGVLGRENIAG